MSAQLTFGRFVEEAWAPALQKRHSPVTARAYLNTVRRNSARLERLPMPAITGNDIALMLACADDGHLSPGSLRAMRSAFSSVFKFALELGIIRANPMLRPRQGGPTHRTRPFAPFDDDQLTRIEELLPYYPGSNVFGTALHSDLSRSQILGISAEGFETTIGKSQVRIPTVVLEGTTQHVTVRPNPNAITTRSVSQKARRYLEAEFSLLAVRAGQPGFYNQWQLLFVGASGEPLSLKELERSTRAIAQAAGVPGFSLRNLRQTYRLRHNESEVL